MALGIDREPAPIEDVLFGDLASLIEAARIHVATTVNSELVMLYWGIGRRIRDEVLGGERSAYGRDIVKRVAARLSERYGRGYGWRNLFRMVKFAELYPDAEILSPLATILTWSNIVELLTIDEQARRDFYMAMCAHERWSKRTLRAKIDGKLYERTVHAAGSAAAAQYLTEPMREEMQRRLSPIAGELGEE